MATVNAAQHVDLKGSGVKIDTAWRWAKTGEFYEKNGQNNFFLLMRKSLIPSLYRASQEECARLRESVPYVKVYRYNPKHLYPKLNGYGDNGLKKVGASCGSKYCNLHSWCHRATALMTLRVECSVNRACVTVSCLYGSWKRHVKCLEP